MRVRDVVTLHPETVTNHERLARPRKRPRRRRNPVTTITVNPKVWRKALQLSDGNPRRIVIESETSVLVKN